MLSMRRQMWIGLTCGLLSACATSGDSGTGSDGDASVGQADTGNTDGGTADVAGETACVVFETSQLVCFDAPDGDILRSIDSCEPGTGCVPPSPRNVDHDEIQCIDEYRYGREVYPANCTEVSDWFHDRRECLVPAHCSGNEDRVGDWRCQGGDCLCPEGGDCPTPLPPGTGEDAGPDDTPEPDAGSADAGSPDDPDAHEAPDRDEEDGGGPPGPPDGG